MEKSQRKDSQGIIKVEDNKVFGWFIAAKKPSMGSVELKINGKQIFSQFRITKTSIPNRYNFDCLVDERISKNDTISISFETNQEKVLIKR